VMASFLPAYFDIADIKTIEDGVDLVFDH
jgi:hypothetical protein